MEEKFPGLAAAQAESTEPVPDPRDADSYAGCSIVNIRRGKGARNRWFYADVIAADGTPLISATLDYCVSRIQERLEPGE